MLAHLFLCGVEKGEPKIIPYVETDNTGMLHMYTLYVFTVNSHCICNVLQKRLLMGQSGNDLTQNSC